MRNKKPKLNLDIFKLMFFDISFKFTCVVFVRIKEITCIKENTKLLLLFGERIKFRM